MVWAVVAAFGTYFCMYAFRKPFAVAQFDGLHVGDWDYKVIAVASQVLGYTLSKFIGIKVLTELKPNRRAWSIIALILLAELALILLAIVPAPWNLFCLFLNGLPLGMVFGLVISFLEGRRQTEALAAILCTSFILADGFTKSVGKLLLDSGISQFWMPAGVGILFLLPLLGFVWMLSGVKQPSKRDIVARSERGQMTSQDRKSFIIRYAGGLIPLLLMYLMVTVVRSIRSDFAPEIWGSLGVTTTPELFSISELWVGLAVTLANGFAVLITNNYRAFRVAILICITGSGLLLAAAFGQHTGHLSGFTFMVLIGIGLYLPYVATHTTLFERMLAITRDRGSLVFLMYLADAIGYLGYVAVMMARNALDPGGDFMVFFLPMCYITGGLSITCMLACQFYFSRQQQLAYARSLAL